MRRFSLFTLLCLLLIVGQAQATISDYIHYWKLDDASGTTAVDQAGSGTLNGTWAGTPNWLTSGSCQVNGCAQFDGSTQDIQVSTSGVLHALSAFSIGCWYYSSATSATTQGYAYIEKNTGSAADIAIATSTVSTNEKQFFRIRDSGGVNRNFTGATTIALNTWYHSVVTVDAASHAVVIYTNGSADLTDTTTWNGTYDATGVNDVSLAGNATNGLWNGRVDECRLYNRVLTSGDVTELYTVTAGSAAVIRRRAIVQ